MFISKGIYGYGQSKNVFLLSVQKRHLPVRDCKRPHLKKASIGPRTKFYGNPGVPLAMVPCLHQSNVYIKRNLRVWRVQKCFPLIAAKTTLICARLQTTRSQVSQYSAENRNLRKSGSTCTHGTVFAPKQCLYQNEATGMENQKMYFSHRCKNLTHLCWTGNDPVSSKPVLGRERKFAEIRVYLYPWYRVCTSNVYIKTKLRVWRTQKCIPLVGVKTSLTCA